MVLGAVCDQVKDSGGFCAFACPGPMQAAKATKVRQRVIQVGVFMVVDLTGLKPGVLFVWVKVSLPY
jgi:hypothetical protein